LAGVAIFFYFKIIMVKMKWNLVDSLRKESSLQQLAVNSIIKILLINRGIESENKANEFLFPDFERDIYSPFLFSQMEKVVERIKIASEKKEKVVIFGDYDADGITSAVILKQALEDLSIETSVYIPDKKNEGYGLNLLAISKLKKENISLIITVDCGITGIKEVELAKKLGMDVIITDHHHVPEKTPQAFAIINPHQKNSGYPFADLAGVGVAFKVAQAIYEKLMPEKKEQTKWMLDLVAIGTVADCVPLIGENRIIVKYGLLVLAKTRRAGLRELFSVGKIVIDENNIPDTQKISFYIAPRINAAGRINHANLAYDLIVADSKIKARNFALELEANNCERQKITEQVAGEIRILAENSFADKKFIFAQGEHFSIGVVGLVAGKISTQYNKPVAIFQKNEKESKGSLRSIPQINIIEILEKCSDLLLKYGGHSQAAGVSVENKKMEALYEKMNMLIEKELLDKDMTPAINIDTEIFSKDIDFDLLDALEKMQPFGEGNPQPLFLMKQLEILEIKTVGSTKKHFKLFLKPKDQSPKIFEAIIFNGWEKMEKIVNGDIIDMVFSLQRDQWNGNNKISLVIEDFNLSKI
jgi:single-stranded-DNA-specific exonuclease